MPISPAAAIRAAAYASFLLLAVGPAAHADIILPTSGPTLLFTEGNLGSNLLAATFSTTNSALMASDFFATVDWGDGLFSNGTISSNGPGFDVLASHTYADEGNFTPSVHLTSDDGGDTTVGDVANVADAPLTNGSLNTGALVEGTPLNGVLASFQDGNPSATPFDFAVTIHWGDGGSDLGTVSANGAGQFNISSNHKYADEGIYPVDIQVQDIGGSSLDIQGSAAVADAPLGGNGLTLTPTAGVGFTAPVASLTDGNPGAPPSDFLASIDWGDGTLSSGAIAGSGGSYQVSGTHTYALSGVYTVSTEVDDAGNSSVTLTGEADVASAPAAPVPEPGGWLLAALGATAVWQIRRRTFAHDARR